MWRFPKSDQRYSGCVCLSKMFSQGTSVVSFERYSHREMHMQMRLVVITRNALGACHANGMSIDGINHFLSWMDIDRGQRKCSISAFIILFVLEDVPSVTKLWKRNL